MFNFLMIEGRFNFMYLYQVHFTKLRGKKTHNTKKNLTNFALSN